MSTAMKPVLTQTDPLKTKLPEQGGDAERTRTRPRAPHARIENPLGDFAEQTGALFG